MKYLCGVLALLFSSHLFAVENVVTEEKRSNIIKLMEITNALDMGLQMSQVMTSQLTNVLTQTNPEIPKEKYVLLQEVVDSVIEEQVRGEGGFIEILIPVYHRYYTNEDLEGLIAFYQTSLGKKTIDVMPSLMQDSIAVGQLWGQQLGPIVVDKLKVEFEKEGYTLAF
ncbi:hypothetical protein NM22_18965 [Vibrio tubiashii]|nr:hypothetical protein NM22_18965 [Vibrio tubiashii]